jgi:predicted transcriptional regulator
LRDKLELKLVPDENVKIGVAMNERIAGIAFPDLKGKMDFNSGFTSGSIHFHKWCRDLFSFYWNRLKKPF